MEQGPQTPDLRGYWWQCGNDPAHTESRFNSIASKPLVEFFYHLAESGWNQDLLRHPCPKCGDGEMRITYDFPRKVDKVRLRLVHVVGLTGNLPAYLPMIWEAMPHNESEPWFDFKYVGRSDRGYEAYGLARPAVFSRGDLQALFNSYRQITGHELLA